jgi:uncharacterized protein
MLKVLVHGIKDGEHEIELTAPVKSLPGIFEEFIGDVRVSGSLKKLGKRFTVICTVECTALLECDRSLQDYKEVITADLQLSYLANTELYILNKDMEVYDNKEILIHEDDVNIDLSDVVVEVLAVSIPMKRISPEYQDKELEEIYPDIMKIEEDEEESKDSDTKIDDRWSNLKNIKFN